MGDRATYKNLTSLFKNIEDYEYKDRITDLMIEGVWSLETSLFSQMDSEPKRITKIKETISRLEDSLLDPKQIDKLDLGDKMALYNRLNANLHKELALLQNFQHSIPQALKNIDSLDQINSGRRGRSQQVKNKKEQEATHTPSPGEKPVHLDLKKTVINGSPEATKSERGEKSQPVQEKKEQKATPAPSLRGNPDSPYLKKTVINGMGQKLGTITKIIDGQLAVLSHETGKIVVPKKALTPYDDFLIFRLSEENLKKWPPYKEGGENDPSWIGPVRASFAWQPSVSPPTNKGPEPIRKPDSEEGDNGNQGK